VNAVPQELRETVEMLKGVYADPASKLAVGDIAKTFGLSSGFQPYDLAPYAVILQPVFSPIRNKLARQKGQGKQFEFKGVTSVDTSGANGIAVEGTVASTIATQFADVTVNFESYGLASDPVTYEQLWAGQGKPGDFSIDSRALAIANLLKAVMIVEEKLILFGNGASTQVASSGGDSWTFGGPVATATAPTCVISSTGGSLTSNVYVKVSQVTGMGESVPSAAVTNACGTTSTNLVTVTPVRKTNTPVLSYNVYASTDNTNFYLQGSTNGKPFVITAVSTGGVAPPTVDVSGSANAFAGIWSYLFAGGSNAQLSNLAGPLSSLTSLDTVLQNLWNNSSADPDDLWCHSNEVGTLTSLTVGSGAPYYLGYSPGQQSDVIGRYRVSRYTNPATGKVLPLNVHKYIPQGNILATSTELPAWYIGNNVPTVWSMALTQDYVEIDYEPTVSAPKWQSEIRCFGGLVCYVPSVNGLLYGISTS
jgi:hypothetical protein